MSTFDVLCRASSNMNARDKSVKVIQYGARMIMGYYGGLLKVDSMKSLQLILSTCILGRRSFRIFKSVNHIQLLILKLDKLSKKNVFLSIQDRIYVIECVEALEQLFWALFFFFDNIILGIKMGVLDLNLQKYEGLFFPCWFTADACMFVKSAIALYGNMQSRRMLNADILEVDNLYQSLDTTPRTTKKKVTFRGLSLLKGGSGTEQQEDTKENIDDETTSPAIMSQIKGQCDVIPSTSSDIKNGNVISKDVINNSMNGTNEKSVPKNGSSNNAVKNHWSSLSLSEEKIDLPQIITKKDNVDTENKEDSVTEKNLDEINKLENSTSATAPKKSLNIHDFQNTTIEKILNSNSNITKILSTERVSKESGVTEIKNGVHVDKIDGEVSVSDNHESNIDSTTDSSGKVDKGITKSDKAGGVCDGDKVEQSSVEDDSSESTDVSDPDTSYMSDDKGQYTGSECAEPMRANLMDRMDKLNKDESVIYWKIAKSLVDMSVSGSFNPSLPFKRILGEGTIGVLGVISASMAIYDEMNK